MSHELTQVSVRLMVLGPMDHLAETSRIVGVVPSEVWRAGDPIRPNIALQHKQYVWILRAEPEVHDPSDGIQCLKRMIPKPQAFRNLPPTVQVQIAIGIIARAERPSFHLNAATTAWIGLIGASLDVDVYDFSGADQWNEELK